MESGCGVVESVPSYPTASMDEEHDWTGRFLGSREVDIDWNGNIVGYFVETCLRDRKGRRSHWKSEVRHVWCEVFRQSWNKVFACEVMWGSFYRNEDHKLAIDDKKRCVIIDEMHVRHCIVSCENPWSVGRPVVPGLCNHLVIGYMALNNRKILGTLYKQYSLIYLEP